MGLCMIREKSKGVGEILAQEEADRSWLRNIDLGNCSNKGR